MGIAEHQKCTIVLPTYNGARYISQAIESCLAQSYTNIELILVDDGSTDETPRLIAECKDSRVLKLRHETNRGLAIALNTGFAQAQGQYLTWTSDDNLYAANALQVMVAFLDEHTDVDFVYADYWLIDEHGKVFGEKSVGTPLQLRETNCVGPCFLYRREVYETIGDYNPQARLAEDYEYWLRVQHKFVLMPLHQPLYYYRLHRYSLTGHSGTAHTAQRVAHRVRRDLGIITNTEYRRALAQVDIDEAFLHYQNGNLAAARSLLIRGLCQDPRWCKNRGVISILLQSLGIWHKRARSKNYA